MNNTLLGLIVFLGMFSLLTVAFFGSQYQIATSNVNQSFFVGNATYVNTTLGVTAQFTPPTCQFNSGALVIFDIPGAIGCVMANIGWFYSLVFLRSDIPYLNIILIGIGAVIVAWIVRILRGSA
jgi:hypothetical protein